MKKLFILSIFLLGYTVQGTAQEITKENKIVKTSFWVNGVCDMCQTRIQKAALKTKGVKMANWNIESKTLVVMYNRKKCSIEDIKQNILAIGHDSVGFTATDEAYNNLHHCCKYDRTDKPE